MGPKSKRTWLLVSTDKNWKICKKRCLFGLNTTPGRVRSMLVGDRFVTYIVSKGFVDYGKVTATLFRGKSRIWADRFYPFRFRIDIDRSKHVLVNDLSIIDRISFVRNKKKWGLYFISGVRQIPEEDYQLLVLSMKRGKYFVHTMDLPGEKKSSNSFQNKIATLMTHAGFVVTDNNNNRPGPDIVVEDPENRTKFIIQCKKAERNEKRIGLNHLIYEYAERLREGGLIELS